MLIRHWRQVRRGVGNRLDARFLVIGDERHVWRRLLHGLVRSSRIRFGAGSHSVGLYRTQDRNLLIDTQHFSHLRVKRRVAPLQVVAHFVRFHLLLGENLADRALRDPCQADMPRTRRMLSGMASQQSRRPEFMRISHVLRLLAGQRHQPRPCFQRDLRLLAGPWDIVKPAITPNRRARARQRWTVWWVTPTVIPTP
jgi:hypothetical protein